MKSVIKLIILSLLVMAMAHGQSSVHNYQGQVINKSNVPQKRLIANYNGGSVQLNVGQNKGSVVPSPGQNQGANGGVTINLPGSNNVPALPQKPTINLPGQSGSVQPPVANKGNIIDQNQIMVPGAGSGKQVYSPPSTGNNNNYAYTPTNPGKGNVGVYQKGISVGPGTQGCPNCGPGCKCGPGCQCKPGCNGNCNPGGATKGPSTYQYGFNGAPNTGSPQINVQIGNSQKGSCPQCGRPGCTGNCRPNMGGHGYNKGGPDYSYNQGGANEGFQPGGSNKGYGEHNYDDSYKGGGGYQQDYQPRRSFWDWVLPWRWRIWNRSGRGTIRQRISSRWQNRRRLFNGSRRRGGGFFGRRSYGNQKACYRCARSRARYY